MVRLIKVAIVVHVVYIITPFWTCVTKYFSLIKQQHLMKHHIYLLYICHTNQHTEEPKVYIVIFLEPWSINIQPMADEAYHGVVCADDQDEENQCSNHDSLADTKIMGEKKQNNAFCPEVWQILVQEFNIWHKVSASKANLLKFREKCQQRHVNVKVETLTLGPTPAASQHWNTDWGTSWWRIHMATLQGCSKHSHNHSYETKVKQFVLWD